MHIHMQAFNHIHMCTNAFTVIQITHMKCGETHYGSQSVQLTEEVAESNAN